MQRTWWPEAGTIIVTGPYCMIALWLNQGGHWTWIKPPARADSTWIDLRETAACPDWLKPEGLNWLIDASCPGWLRPVALIWLMPPVQVDWGLWGWSDWCLLSRLTVGLNWLMPPVQADWSLWGWTDWCLQSRLTEACGADLIEASCPGWLRHVGLIWLMPPVQADCGAELIDASCPGWLKLLGLNWLMPPVQTEACGAELIDASCPGWLKPVGLNWLMPPVQADWGLWGWSDLCLLSRLIEAQADEACGAGLMEASCPG